MHHMAGADCKRGSNIDCWWRDSPDKPTWTSLHSRLSKLETAEEATPRYMKWQSHLQNFVVAKVARPPKAWNPTSQWPNSVASHVKNRSTERQGIEFVTQVFLVQNSSETFASRRLSPQCVPCDYHPNLHWLPRCRYAYRHTLVRIRSAHGHRHGYRPGLVCYQAGAEQQLSELKRSREYASLRVCL